MEKHTDVVQAAILVTQYEQQAKADLVKLQFQLGQCQSRGKAISETLSRDNVELQQMQVEIQHLCLAADSNKHRATAAAAQIPALTQRASKAREEADLVIASILKSKAATEAAISETRQIAQQKLRMQEGIVARIKARVQPLLKRISACDDEKAGLARECEAITARQQALYDLRAAVAKLASDLAEDDAKVQKLRDRNATFGLPALPQAAASSASDASAMSDGVERAEDGVGTRADTATMLLSVRVDADALATIVRDPAAMEQLHGAVGRIWDIVLDLHPLCRSWRWLLRSLGAPANAADAPGQHSALCINCSHRELNAETDAADQRAGAAAMSDDAAEDTQAPTISAESAGEDRHHEAENLDPRAAPTSAAAASAVVAANSPAPAAMSAEVRSVMGSGDPIPSLASRASEDRSGVPSELSAACKVHRAERQAHRVEVYKIVAMGTCPAAASANEEADEADDQDDADDGADLVDLAAAAAGANADDPCRATLADEFAAKGGGLADSSEADADPVLAGTGSGKQQDQQQLSSRALGRRSAAQPVDPRVISKRHRAH